MHKLKSFVTVCVLFVVGMFVFVLNANAQQEPQTADFMRSNGKIYVVVAVILIILIGLFLYLANLDSKISKIEKGNNGI